MYLVAVIPSPSPAKVPSIAKVLCTMPNSPSLSLPRIRTTMIEDASVSTRVANAPTSDQAAPLASRLAKGEWCNRSRT